MHLSTYLHITKTNMSREPGTLSEILHHFHCRIKVWMLVDVLLTMRNKAPNKLLTETGLIPIHKKGIFCVGIRTYQVT